MAFTLKVRLPQYRGAEDITVRIYEPGESVRMNGDEDDAMADTASDGLFLATIDEELVGDFEYEAFRAGTTIQTGVFTRVADQAVVLADNPDDFVASIVALVSTGQFLVPFTIKNSLSVVVPYCEVNITRSSTGDTIEVVQTGTCNEYGRVEFKLNPGDYFLWRNKARHEFTDPVEFSVSSEGVLTVSS